MGSKGNKGTEKEKHFLYMHISIALVSYYTPMTNLARSHSFHCSSYTLPSTSL